MGNVEFAVLYNANKFKLSILQKFDTLSSYYCVLHGLRLAKNV